MDSTKVTFDKKSNSATTCKQNRYVIKRTSGSKKNFFDLSNGLENVEILISNKNKTKLTKTKFDYKVNYIVSSYIKNADIEEYRLTNEYCCSCVDICSKSSCECIINHVQVYECNDNCMCNDKNICENRVTQKGLTKKLKVDFISSSKGFGVFALENIQKGEFICEYVGQIINKYTALRKINENLINKKPNYVLQVRENYEKIAINTFIDAEKSGNVSRFLNHSCEPNLYFDIVRVNHFIPQVAFFAKRDIEEGEELTFSYCSGETREENFLENSIKLCECGQKTCKRFLPS